MTTSAPNNDDDSCKQIPILIIPGFMISGLEIRESSLKKLSEGKGLTLARTRQFGSRNKGMTPSILDIQEEEDGCHRTFYRYGCNT
jgi:hypothetical protein